MLHHAMGLDSTDYDMKVLAITSEITKQVFPFTLDLDHPKFKAGLDQLVQVQADVNAARARGGIAGKLAIAGCAVRGALTFAKLFFLPVRNHTLPAQVRMAPTW
jgi:magnesium-protoporphyrin IX monomethyl ester (oxidative) cyclase